MPMSASCILNRSEVLALVDDIRELLPEEFRHAEMLLQDREAVIEEGRREVDRLLNEARATRDPAARKVLYDEAAVILEAEKPVIYLYFLPYPFAMSSKLKGFVGYPDGMIRLRNVSLAP